MRQNIIQRITKRIDMSYLAATCKSHSNMKLLHDLEGSEDDKILREIVVHPDGLVSGSWYRNKKILAE